MRYRAIDLARRNARHEAGRADGDLTELCAGTEDVIDRAISRDDAHSLRASLSQLPEVQQEVIALAFYGQLSHTEIAAQLHLPTGTVKGRMRLGLERLRSSIEHGEAGPTRRNVRYRSNRPHREDDGFAWPEVSALVNNWISDAQMLVDTDESQLPEALASLHARYEQIHPAVPIRATADRSASFSPGRSSTTSASPSSLQSPALRGSFRSRP